MQIKLLGQQAVKPVAQRTKTLDIIAWLVKRRDGLIMARNDLIVVMTWVMVWQLA